MLKPGVPDRTVPLKKSYDGQMYKARYYDNMKKYMKTAIRYSWRKNRKNCIREKNSSHRQKGKCLVRGLGK